MIWYQALFSLQGRLNRKGFWIGVAIHFVILFIIANFFFNHQNPSWWQFIPLVICGYSLCTIIVKRLHDRNRSGWTILIVLVPILCYGTSLITQGTFTWLLGIFMPTFISVLLFLEWGVFQGQKTPNRFGAKGLSILFK